MSRSVNKVILIGNVGVDPEIRTTVSGTRVAKLSLATTRRYKDRSGQRQERTDWHRLTVFGRTVDVVESYVNKGDRLYVEGRIEYSTTETSQGETKYWTDIIIDELVMLSPNNKFTSSPRTATKKSGNTKKKVATPAFDDEDDDIPF